MEDITQLEQEIERKRKEMHIASDQYGMTSGAVLEKSKELDALLNLFNRKRRYPKG